MSVVTLNYLIIGNILKCSIIKRPKTRNLSDDTMNSGDQMVFFF